MKYNFIETSIEILINVYEIAQLWIGNSFPIQLKFMESSIDTHFFGNDTEIFWKFRGNSTEIL